MKKLITIMFSWIILIINCFSLSLTDDIVLIKNQEKIKIGTTSKVNLNYDNFSYLMSANPYLKEDIVELHKFTKEGEYVESFYFGDNNVDIYYLPVMENEREKYKEAGFQNFPDFHITNINNNTYYLDQGETGEWNEYNCAPSSYLMAIKSIDPNFDITVEELRYMTNTEPYNGVYNLSLDKVIEKYGFKINYTEIKNKDKNYIINEIINRKLPILHANMEYISNYSSNRIGQALNTYKHAFMVTGFLICDGAEYFEVFDPYSMFFKDNNRPVGKGRFFNVMQVIDAIEFNYPYVTTIEKDTY